MKQNSTRMNRINDEILREVAEIIRGELKDPRINSMITVTKTKTTTDLKTCKVYVSIMGEKEEQENTLQALSSSSSYIRKEIAHRLNLRHTPLFTFVLDDSLDYSIKIQTMLNQIKDDKARHEEE